MDNSIVLTEYNISYEAQLVAFLQKCLPESGRALDLDGRHAFYKDIAGHFLNFWVMLDNSDVIGAAAVRKIDAKSCELKSLYLLECYHGRGYGRQLLIRAIEYARDAGYEKMYLDTLSTSHKAIALYDKTGFSRIEKYNQSERSDVFMVLDL